MEDKKQESADKRIKFISKCKDKIYERNEESEMKIIDLLNKIANNEEIPTRIRYKNEIYKAEYNSIFKQNYYEIEEKYCNKLLLGEIHSVTQLNDEVEIIEEEKKIPEKFKVHSFGDKKEDGSFVDSAFPTNEELMNKINGIIDYLQSKGE